MQAMANILSSTNLVNSLPPYKIMGYLILVIFPKCYSILAQIFSLVVS